MASLGQKLADARTRKGISIREASESTKIRGDYLTKFESDDFEMNLPAVYLRGFLTNYARYLNLDPEGILADFEASQPAGKSRSPLQAIGTITVDSPKEDTASSGDSPPPIPPTNPPDDFPWVKFGLIAASFVALIIIAFLVVKFWPEGEEAGPEKDKQLPVEEPQRMQDLQIVAKGPIKEMIIQMDDGPSERMTDIAQGEILPFKFSKSFKGAATEMENISLVIDGATYRLPEKGKGNFVWPAD